MKSSAQNSSKLRRVLWPAVCVFIVSTLVSARGAQPAAAVANSLPGRMDTPLYFEADAFAGEASPRFIARGQQCNLLLSPTEATIVLGTSGRPSASGAWDRITLAEARDTRLLRLRLVGANPSAKISGLQPLSGKANYLLGNDPAGWRTGVPLYSHVQVDEVYPGVRVIYYADEAARLEYDFCLQPHARVDQIALHIEGADRVWIDANGELVIKVGNDEIRQHKPVIYQMVSGVRKPIDGGYTLSGKTVVGFRLGEYDRELPLVIDPTLTFSTYLGGTKVENGWDIALDPAGNIYVTGETLSMGLQGTNNFATNGVPFPKYRGGLKGFGDAFVAKYDNDGVLQFITYLGGKTDDGGFGIAADATGIYVTGFTDSTNFPIVPTNGTALRTTITNGNNHNAFRVFPIDAFVTKLDPSGTSIIYSTYLGGIRRETGYGIAVSGGSAYVTGLTESTNFFPITPGAFQTIASGNIPFVNSNNKTSFVANAEAFVTVLDPSGTGVTYSTYLGGTNHESAQSIAVDSTGSAWVTGFTASRNFPTASPIQMLLSVGTNVLMTTFEHLNTQTNRSSATDAFISRLSADGSTLLFSSYLGGSNDDAGLRIAVDGADFAYVTGYTFSKIFPTNATLPLHPKASNFVSHVFVTKVGPGGGTDVPYSVKFGGSQRDEGTGIAVDGSGNAYVTGGTGSTNFPVTVDATGFFSVTNLNTKKAKGTNDVFITKLDATGTSFIFSGYLGGSGSDRANSLALDSSGNAYIVGTTFSQNFPLTTNIAPQTQLGGTKNSKQSDAFVEKIIFP